MKNDPLLFSVVAIALLAAMPVASRLMRTTAGSHWFAHRGTHNDDFDGDGDL